MALNSLGQHPRFGSQSISATRVCALRIRGERTPNSTCFEAFGTPRSALNRRVAVICAPRHRFGPERPNLLVPYSAALAAPRDRHWCLIRPVICSAETGTDGPRRQADHLDDAAAARRPVGLRRLHALQPAGGDGVRRLRGPPPFDGRGPRPAPQEAEGRRAAAPEAPSFSERRRRPRSARPLQVEARPRASASTPSCARSSRPQKRRARPSTPRTGAV